MSNCIIVITIILIVAWAIVRVVNAINTLVRRLSEIPQIEFFRKTNHDLTIKLRETEWELRQVKKQYADLNTRWEQVRKRKEELRHENRALKKINN